MARKAFSWNIPASDDEDTLLTCLEVLTRYYKSPCSKKTLIAGLPLEDNKLTPSLFIRAAERANLEAHISQTALSDLKVGTLPAVLILNSNETCLLVDINDDYARVLYAETGGGLISVKLNELEKHYSGVLIFIKPIYQPTIRSKDTLNHQGKNWFWRVLFKAWPVYAEVLFASALVNTFALAVPLFVMNVYDRVVPNNAIETLWVLAIGVFIVFFFDFTLKSLRAYFIDAVGKKIDVELSAKIFTQILGIKMSERPQSIGALANTVQSFEIFRDFITSTTIMVLVDLPFVLLFITIINLIGGPIYIIPLTALPIVIFVGLILQWPMIQLTKRSYQLSAEKQATLFEGLSGVETIKSLSAESNLQSRFETITTNSAKIGSKLRVVNNLSIHFTMICQQLVTVLVVIYGVYLIGEAKLSMGALIACTILSGRAIAPMSQVAGLITRYYQSINALRAINQIMQKNTDIDNTKRYLHRPNLEPSVEFKHVYFKYGKQQVSSLEDINFVIKSGEKVGIIGSVGAGKSTISKLIMKLYEPDEGNIHIGSILQQQINPSDLRYQLGYLPQEVTLFYGSIKDNIAYGARTTTEQKIIQAAHLAGVDLFIKNISEGYDFQVGENGKYLSLGQRQCIALARALLLEPKLVILDEPCSSIDVITERYITNQLRSYLSKEKTLILSTHKLSLLTLVDRVIVLDKGRIILDGPKEKIIQKLKMVQQRQANRDKNE